MQAGDAAASRLDCSPSLHLRRVGMRKCGGGYPFADEVADAVDAAVCRLVRPGHGIVSVEIADEKKTPAR